MTRRRVGILGLVGLMRRKASPRRTLGPAVIVASLLLTGGAMSGCAFFAWAAHAVHNPKQAAVFKLPDRTTLVMVEDRHRQIAMQTLPDAVAEAIGERLIDEGVVDEVIPHTKLLAYQQKEGDAYHHHSIPRVGRDLGAEQVLYAQVVQLKVIDEHADPRYAVVMDVKVIDAKTGRRLFPDLSSNNAHVGAAGVTNRDRFRITAITARPDKQDTRPKAGDTVWRELGYVMARDIARLFHKYSTLES